MKRISAAFLTAALATALLAGPSAHASAGHASATYVAGYLHTDRTIRNSTVGVNQTVGIGGYTFKPSGTPSTIKLVDGVSDTIPITVCQEGPSQDGEDPLTCGGADSDDIDRTYCVTSNRTTTLSGFRSRIDTVVFIEMQDLNVVCEGQGTTGTVTMYWI